MATLFLASLLAWPSTTREANAASATTFSGRATALQGTVLGTIPVGPFADTGEVNPQGDAREATVLEYPIPGVTDPTKGTLSAEVLHAAVVAGGNKSSAEASVANLSLSAAGQSIAAGFLMARASATCTGSGAHVEGSSEIASLTLNGQTTTVRGQANETITIPGVGQIIINEQITDSSASADRGGLTVNALHVRFPGVVDLTVASAHADIACGGTPPCAKQDFVTGGGWITTSSGSRANFAVAGGIKNGDFWGHLTYIDHGTPVVKVKGTGVTGYVVFAGTTRRQIDGTTANGTYTADVADNGEPGHGVDTFSLTLSSGYSASGPLGGGNIQLHCK